MTKDRQTHITVHTAVQNPTPPANQDPENTQSTSTRNQTLTQTLKTDKRSTSIKIV